MEIFILKPSKQLSEYVKHYWVIEDFQNENITKERILPYGNVELIFHFGDRIMQTEPDGVSFIQPRSMLCGQKNHYNDISSTGKIGLFAVSFFPYGAKPFFKFPLNEALNQQLNISDYFGYPGKLIEEQIFCAKSNSIRVQIIESYLMKWLSVNETDYYRTRESIRKIFATKGQIAIPGLSEHVCMGIRQFERLFTSNVGISAKQFQRIVRFHNILSTKEISDFNSFTTLAHECGYYDQSHFITDFKSFTGYTPKEFFKVFDSCAESELPEIKP